MTRNANINLSLVNGYHPLDSHWLLRAEAWLRPPAGCARAGSAAVALRPLAAVRGLGRGEGRGGAGHEPARATHHRSRQCLHNKTERKTTTRKLCDKDGGESKIKNEID